VAFVFAKDWKLKIVRCHPLHGGCLKHWHFLQNKFGSEKGLLKVLQFTQM
jgi:hypothetical protein